jgi:hypothetical protein
MNALRLQLLASGAWVARVLGGSTEVPAVVKTSVGGPIVPAAKPRGYACHVLFTHSAPLQAAVRFGAPSGNPQTSSHSSLRILKAASVALTVFIALSGCGTEVRRSGTTPAVAAGSPAAILAEARTAAYGANSVHVSGTTLHKGTPVLRVDADLASGRGGVARIFTQRGSFGLATVAGVDYALVTGALLKVISPQGARLIERAHGIGKWIRLPSGIPAVAALGNWTNFHGVLERLLSMSGVRKSQARIRGGPPVLTLTNGTGKLTLFIAATGKPYPLELVQQSAGPTATIILFDRWNAPVPLRTRGGA